MNTLQEVVEFTGVTSNAGQHVGSSVRRSAMQTIVSIVPLLSGRERTSMRTMIRRLERIRLSNPPYYGASFSG